MYQIYICLNGILNLNGLPSLGMNPTGLICAISSFSSEQRRKIQSRTRIFSPNPGHKKEPYFAKSAIEESNIRNKETKKQKETENTKKKKLIQIKTHISASSEPINVEDFGEFSTRFLHTQPMT